MFALEFTTCLLYKFLTTGLFGSIKVYHLLFALCHFSTEGGRTLSKTKKKRRGKCRRRKNVNKDKRGKINNRILKKISFLVKLPCSHLVYTLFTHSSFIVHTLFTLCLHIVHTLFTHSSFIVHTLFTHCSHLVYTLFTPCLHIVHT